MNSDRVELFFAVDEELSEYYSLEKDGMGRLFDSHNTRSEKSSPENYLADINYEWDIPKSVIDWKIDNIDQGFYIEGAISMDYLRKMHLLVDGKNNCWCFYSRLQK